MDYELIQEIVSPEKLMLDPNNPRLKKDDFEDITVRQEVLTSDDFQGKLLDRISANEHDVKELIRSIENQGFVSVDSILTRKLRGTGKYLVVEGNRRTAAIKYLISKKNQTKKNLESLRKIPIKIIAAKSSEREKEIADSLVAMRHISGPRQWQPMQRASAIFNAYKKEYVEKYKSETLARSKKVIQSISFKLSLKESNIIEEVMIFFVYKALRNAGFSAHGRHYSLIQLTIARPTFASEFFEIDRYGFKFSNKGMERFNSLFIEKGCSVSNPTLFRKFYQIYNNSTAEVIESILNGGRSVDDVLKNIKERKMEHEFISSLDDIYSKMRKLKLNAVRGTEEEAIRIMSISGFVAKRLMPLVKDYVD